MVDLVFLLLEEKVCFLPVPDHAPLSDAGQAHELCDHQVCQDLYQQVPLPHLLFGREYCHEFYYVILILLSAENVQSVP
jgi:hypothetical protein